MTLGEKIAELRKQKGWTQSILAEKMEVHTNHVSRWETNRQKPPAKALKRLADLFGVTLDDLLIKEQPLPSALSKDRELREKVQQIQELPPDERAIVFRIIDTFSTQKRLAQLLSGHASRS